VPLGSDPLSELSIPDGTTVEEHDLVTDGDVVIGGQSTVEFGVRGRSVIADERVRFGGHIEAEGDCRLDMWCDVADNVLVGDDAYIGERVHIGGELRVAGDLDIGDDVDIEDGFEANGWIVIRNPMPTVVFIFVYLSHLLRIGEDEAAKDVIDEMLGDEDEEKRRKRDFEQFSVTEELLETAPGTKVMHCMPIQGPEIQDTLVDSDRSLIFRQAENRLYSSKAVLEYLVG